MKMHLRQSFAESISKKIISFSILLSMLMLTRAAFAVEGESPAVPTSAASSANYASLEATHLDLGSLGQVLAVVSSATVMRSKGKTEKLERGTLLFQGDSVEMGPGSRAVVRLSDAKVEKSQSVVTLLSGSRLILDEAKADGPENLREVRLTLEKGSLRVQVPPASDPVLPTFHVKMSTAKVNLKGGDAMITLSDSGGRWHSRVQMLDGQATLLTDRSVDGQPDFIDVLEHQQAEFTNKAIPAGGSMGLYQQVVNQGVFTTPTDLDPDELAQILKITDVASAAQAESQTSQKTAASKLAAKRKTAAAQAAKVKRQELAASLCHAPSGQFNQCAWTCTGKNLGKAKTCRTELPGVACVRTICRADGDWKEETRLPSSESDRCPAKGSSVHECGAYW